MIAHANTPEDVYGASARTIAMGGAGTALPGDYAAVHYNPANLSRCTSDEVAFDISYIRHQLSFTDEDLVRPEPLVPKRVRDQTRMMLGTCLQLPLGLSLGALAGFGTPGAIVLDQQVANETPNFVMYGENHQQLSFALGLSWQATSQLSIGAGFAALFTSNLPLDADLPILEPDPSDPSGYRPVAFSLGISLGGKLAPRVGVLYTPSSRFRIGAAYRGPLYHDLDVDAYINAKLIIEIPVPVHVDSLGWFSPRQFSLGASGEPIENLTLGADVTYYRWGELSDNGSSYPFLNMYSLDPERRVGRARVPAPAPLRLEEQLGRSCGRRAAPRRWLDDGPRRSRLSHARGSEPGQLEREPARRAGRDRERRHRVACRPACSRARDAPGEVDGAAASVVALRLAEGDLLGRGVRAHRSPVRADGRPCRRHGRSDSGEALPFRRRRTAGRWQADAGMVGAPSA